MIELHPFAPANIPKLISWIDSPSALLVWAGPIFRYPLDEDQFHEHLLDARGTDPKLMPFEIDDLANGDMVGYLELARIDRVNRSATLSRVIVGPREMRGRGIGSQAVQAVLRIAFDQLSLHRVEVHVLDFNSAAIACYEKAAFRMEGLMREARILDGEYQNLCVLGILETEWRAGNK